MTNHFHLIAVPERQDSLAVLLRRVHGRYAQYYNTRTGRTGHLWQNRYFACVLDRDHLWKALAYVDRNPVRAAYLSGRDDHGVLDMNWWLGEARQPVGEADLEAEASLRRCTYAGRPFGSETFVGEMSEPFGRYWTRGRPKKERRAEPEAAAKEIAQFRLTGF